MGSSCMPVALDINWFGSASILEHLRPVRKMLTRPPSKRKCSACVEKAHQLSGPASLNS